jgi:hypothetical protein
MRVANRLAYPFALHRSTATLSEPKEPRLFRRQYLSNRGACGKWIM